VLADALRLFGIVGGDIGAFLARRPELVFECASLDDR
jgi:hypothetical protein